MLTVNGDLSYTVKQDTHDGPLEHGPGFLTAWRSKESWTPYTAVCRTKQTPVTKVEAALDFTQCHFAAMYCLHGICKSSPDPEKDKWPLLDGNIIKDLWTYFKTTMLPSL